MASQPASGILRLIGAHDPVCELADADLLARFHAQREQRAFGELVRRHGPMVLGVCQRVVGTSADAEDAFQAVFVVLARRAGDVRQPELLSHWLYGVAYRIARKARRMTARQRGREVPMANVPEQIERSHEPFPELAGILDEELARLPEWYRLPIVLCDLQGLSRAEAATRLGVPEGTLSSRLANGRKKLADRLTNRGISLAALTLFLTDQVRANVPHRLLDATIETAMTTAFGGTVSTAITQLAYEGLFTMKKLLIVAVAISMTTVGVVLTTISADDKKTPPVVKAEVKKEDVKEEKQPKTRVEWSKPKMIGHHDLDGVATKIIWGGDGMQPYLFVEERKLADENDPGRVHVYRLRDENVVTSQTLSPRHHLVDVFQNEPAFVTRRIDYGGVNSVRELRYYESKLKLDGMSKNIGLVEIKPGQVREEPNSFRPRNNWVDPKRPESVDPVIFDTQASEVFHLSADSRGIWNIYYEANERKQIVKAGLRLLHPITGDELNRLPNADASYIERESYAHSDRIAVGQITVKNSTSVTCWNLEKGTINWQIPSLPDMRTAKSTAVSADGNTIAIAYDMSNRRTYTEKLNELIATYSRDTENIRAFEKISVQSVVEKRTKEIRTKWNESFSAFEDKYPNLVIRVVNAITGKQTGEISLTRGDNYSKIHLSPDGELLLLSTDTFVVKKPTPPNYILESDGSRLLRVYQTHTGKLIHHWNDVSSHESAFRPSITVETLSWP